MEFLTTLIIIFSICSAATVSIGAIGTYIYYKIAVTAITIADKYVDSVDININPEISIDWNKDDREFYIYGTSPGGELRIRCELLESTDRSITEAEADALKAAICERIRERAASNSDRSIQYNSEFDVYISGRPRSHRTVRM